MPTTPATPTRAPPAYLASGTQLPSRTPRGTPLASVQLGPITQRLLMDEAHLAPHYDAIRLICRVFPPIRWSAEIDNLTGFPVDAKEALMEAFERDEM